MYDEDAIYELGEQIRADADKAVALIWEKTHDKDLWFEILGLIAGPLEDKLLKIYEEVGIEICDECGERVDDCTCDEDTEDADENEADEVKA